MSQHGVATGRSALSLLKLVSPGGEQLHVHAARKQRDFRRPHRCACSLSSLEGRSCHGCRLFHRCMHAITFCHTANRIVLPRRRWSCCPSKCFLSNSRCSTKVAPLVDRSVFILKKQILPLEKLDGDLIILRRPNRYEESESLRLIYDLASLFTLQLKPEEDSSRERIVHSRRDCEIFRPWPRHDGQSSETDAVHARCSRRRFHTRREQMGKFRCIKFAERD